MRSTTMLLLSLAMTSPGMTAPAAADPRALAPTAAPPGRTQVFVVGTLYRRHERVTGYDLAALQRTIEAIKPDAVVLDVTPEELRTRTVHASKIEYPGVIFPLIDRLRCAAFPAEPAEPMFSEIVQKTIAENRAFEEQRPTQAAALKQFTEAMYASLTAMWESPADVNSATTDRVFAGKHALQARLMGPPESDGWDRWNQHTADEALRAAREHQGKRVLVLVGIENRYWLNDHLRNAPDIELMDVEAWLRKNVATATR